MMSQIQKVDQPSLSPTAKRLPPGGDCARLELINGKELMSQNKQEAIDKAVAGGWSYTNRLIGVALAAGQVVAGAKDDGRYHCRVSKQRYNMLRRALEALRKQQ